MYCVLKTASHLHPDSLFLAAHRARYIGLLPSDATAPALAAALPPPREGVTVVDLTTMSYDDMLAAARETVKPGLNPFDALLPEQPGVRRSRQAFISGVRANLSPL